MEIEKRKIKFLYFLPFFKNYIPFNVDEKNSFDELRKFSG